MVSTDAEKNSQAGILGTIHICGAAWVAFQPATIRDYFKVVGFLPSGSNEEEATAPQPGHLGHFHGRGLTRIDFDEYISAGNHLEACPWHSIDEVK